VADQELVVRAAVVVILVAARVGAARGVQPGVARSLAADVVVAERAVVFGDGDAHGARAFRPVFAMAGDAAARVELGEAVGVARVGEDAAWVRVFGRRELLPVATGACGVERVAAAEGRVAGVARELELMVSVARGAGHEQRPIARFTGHERNEAGERGCAQDRPCLDGGQCVSPAAQK
jgi:hypothetical protein